MHSLDFCHHCLLRLDLLPVMDQPLIHLLGPDYHLQQPSRQQFRHHHYHSLCQVDPVDQHHMA
jgi:hypothetical protein